MMRSKLGLTLAKKNDSLLIESLEKNLQASETDMTIFFRKLSDFRKEFPEQGIKLVENAFYKIDEIDDDLLNNWQQWFSEYAKRLKEEPIPFNERQKKMNKVNPKYVLRKVFSEFDTTLQLVMNHWSLLYQWPIEPYNFEVHILGLLCSSFSDAH